MTALSELNLLIPTFNSSYFGDSISSNFGPIVKLFKELGKCSTYDVILNAYAFLLLKEIFIAKIAENSQYRQILMPKSFTDIGPSVRNKLIIFTSITEIPEYINNGALRSLFATFSVKFFI
jgi:hypothetical protein